MNEIIIRNIQKKDYKQAHKFQVEYLDDEAYENFTKRVESNPDLYLCALDGDMVIGVCYGHSSQKIKDAIQLQGIAVNLDTTKGYSRQGIGSKMIKIFEQAVKKRRCNKIDVGSADDVKVEKFYLKNGFKPYELVVFGPEHKEIKRVNVDDYESGKVKQAELRKKCNPKEVIFIFKKMI